MILLQQQIFLGTGKGGVEGSLIDRYFTNGLVENMSVFSAFVMAIIGLMALVGGLKVYNKWQAGEQDATRDAFRWGISIVAVLILWAVLENYTGTQEATEHYNLEFTK